MQKNQLLLILSGRNDYEEAKKILPNTDLRGIEIDSWYYLMINNPNQRQIDLFAYQNKTNQFNNEKSYECILFSTEGENRTLVEKHSVFNEDCMFPKDTHKILNLFETTYPGFMFGY